MNELEMCLSEILHGDSDKDRNECQMKRLVVASHICFSNHYLVTWEPDYEFIIWYLNDRGRWEKVETFNNPVWDERNDNEFSFKSASNMAEEYFEEWLANLGKED